MITMRDVNGPDDVKPGDLVRYTEWGAVRNRESTVTVVRATPSRLTFRRTDGTIAAAAYTKMVTVKVFRTSQRRVHRNFHALNARDLWIQQMPVSHFAAPVMGAEGVRSVVVLGSALTNADDLAVVHDEIDRLAAWMATGIGS